LSNEYFCVKWQSSYEGQRFFAENRHFSNLIKTFFDIVKKWDKRGLLTYVLMGKQFFEY
jgi:hypothetical protein